jgi:hypothetical protein
MLYIQTLLFVWYGVIAFDKGDAIEGILLCHMCSIPDFRSIIMEILIR